MPASITHELVAWAALEELPKKIAEQIYEAPDYYFLGSQGPDLFFFYRPIAERENNFGRHLHGNHVLEWFSAMLSALPNYAGEEFENCLAYALGFCTHLSADAAFHPFVYNYLKSIESSRFSHQEIENDWDVYFLKKLRGKSARGYEYPYDLKKIAEDGILFRFVQEAAGNLGWEIHASAFRRMCKGFALYLKHFHTPHARLLRPFGFSEFYPREEPSPCVLKGKRFSDFSEGKGANADELFRHAVDESILRIYAFMNAFNGETILPEALFSVHMLTGKRI